MIRLLLVVGVSVFLLCGCHKKQLPMGPEIEDDPMAQLRKVDKAIAASEAETREIDRIAAGDIEAAPEAPPPEDARTDAPPDDVLPGDAGQPLSN